MAKTEDRMWTTKHNGHMLLLNTSFQTLLVWKGFPQDLGIKVSRTGINWPSPKYGKQSQTKKNSKQMNGQKCPHTFGHINDQVIFLEAVNVQLQSSYCTFPL